MFQHISILGNSFGRPSPHDGRLWKLRHSKILRIRNAGTENSPRSKGKEITICPVICNETNFLIFLATKISYTKTLITMFGSYFSLDFVITTGDLIVANFNQTISFSY